MSSKPRSGSNLVAAGILLSRVAGLIREQAIVVALGASKSASAFRFAMRIPNLLQNLLGEGALSASFIPVYANLVEKGENEKAAKLAKLVVAWLAGVTSIIVVLFILLARPIVWAFTSWEADKELYDQATNLIRITSVGIGFLVVSAWCLGVLNSHRRFFLSYVAPVIWNFAQIIALLIAIGFTFSLTDSALWLCVAVVGGGVAQLLVQLPATLRFINKGSSSSSIDVSSELKDVAKRFAPAAGARGVVQFSSYIDTFLAAAIAVSALPLYTATLPLYLLPISLFGFSIAAAELAEMSRISQDKEQVTTRLAKAVRKVMLPAGFVTAAYLTASKPIVDGLYGVPIRIKNALLDEDTGSSLFGDDQILAVALILTAFAIGLPAAMNSRITQNTLYSLGDVKGPARIAIARVMVVLVASSFLMLQFDWLSISESTLNTTDSFPHWPLLERLPEAIRLDDTEAPHLGPVGLALGASIASWTEFVLLRRRLKSKFSIAATSGWQTKVLLASLVSGSCMLLISLSGFLPSPVDLVVALGLGAVIYYSICQMQGINVLKTLKS